MTLSFDAIVTGLQAHGFPRAVAEARAREQIGLQAPPDPAAERDERVLEKAEQAEVVKIFRAHNLVVYSLSQPRATKQSAGLPDLYVFAPRVGVAFWFEVKRQAGGRVSPAQREFGELTTACGVHHYVGDRYAAWRLLAELEITASPVPPLADPPRYPAPARPVAR